MPTITARIASSGTTSGYFLLEDTEAHQLVIDNVNTASFEVQSGKKYAMLIIVFADAGTKFKLSVEGASKSGHPTDELIVPADGRVLHVFRITG